MKIISWEMLTLKVNLWISAHVQWFTMEANRDLWGLFEQLVKSGVWKRDKVSRQNVNLETQPVMKSHAQQWHDYFKTKKKKKNLCFCNCPGFLPQVVVCFEEAVWLHKALLSWEAPKLGSVEFWAIDDT